MNKTSKMKMKAKQTMANTIEERLGKCLRTTGNTREDEEEEEVETRFGQWTCDKERLESKTNDRSKKSCCDEFN